MKAKKFTRVWIAVAPSFESDGGGQWVEVTAQTKLYVTVMAPTEYARRADSRQSCCVVKSMTDTDHK